MILASYSISHLKLNSCEREYSFLISDHEDRLKIMRSVSIAAAYSMLPLIFRGLMFGNLSLMRANPEGYLGRGTYPEGRYFW